MTVFISRELAPGSVFRSMLENAGHQVFGESLIEITPLSFAEIPACSWIFFSSGNGVRYFFEGLAHKQIPAGIKWAAIGEATARELLGHVEKVDFTGVGDPGKSAVLFAEYAENQTVLFPGARQSEQGIQKRLPVNVHCISLAVYNNQAVSDPRPRPEDILVFTSPLNAEVCLSRFKPSTRQKIVAIGNSTLKKLQKLGIGEVWMPNETSEKGLAELILRELV